MARMRRQHGRMQRWLAVPAAAVVALCAAPTRGQIELHLQVPGQDLRWQIQDPSDFSIIDRVDPPFTREALRHVEIDSDLQAAVDMLASDDYAQREAATTQLLGDDQRRIQMYALLAGESLDAEQRCRLLQVVRQQLVDAPRGALGIQMEQPPGMVAGPQEVKIVSLIAGFPAERVLQVGDRVIAIDGRPLLMPDELRERVQSKRPGEKVSVTVKRPKLDDGGKFVRDDKNNPILEVLTFEFALGSAEVLDRENPEQLRAPSRIQNARKIEARTVGYAYAIEPDVVHIKGGAAQLIHEDEIDRHPRIVELRQEQAIFNQRDSQQDQFLRERWQQTLTSLLQGANKPGLSEQERVYMRRVAERFMQLMNAGS